MENQYDMKKTFLLAAVAALPVLFACSKGDDTRFEDPRFIQYAGRLIPTGTKADAPEALVESIELTESGLFVVGTRTDGKLTFNTGAYSVSGSTYTLPGFGTIELSGSSAMVNPASGASFTASFRRASGANVAYRGWSIDKIRATVNGFHDPVTAEFKGCNFAEISKFLEDNGHKGGYLPSGSLNSISFTGTGSIVFAYSDNTADLGDCTISGSDVSFSWQGETRLFELQNGKATIEYLDGKCILKVEGSLKGSTTSGTVTLVLSPLA